MGVSILVLLDNAYRLRYSHLRPGRRLQVSILVLLDNAYRLACTQGAIGSAAVCLVVSILVLLDNAYRPSAFIFSRVPSSKFQSLFFWIMPTGRSRAYDGIHHYPEFQSLFFWIMPTGYFEEIAREWFRGFNPCSFG